MRVGNGELQCAFTGNNWPLKAILDEWCWTTERTSNGMLRTSPFVDALLHRAHFKGIAGGRSTGDFSLGRASPATTFCPPSCRPLSSISVYVDTYTYITIYSMYVMNGMWLAALRASASKGKRSSCNDGALPFGVGTEC